MKPIVKNAADDTEVLPGYKKRQCDAAILDGERILMYATRYHKPVVDMLQDFFKHHTAYLPLLCLGDSNGTGIRLLTVPGFNGDVGRTCSNGSYFTSLVDVCKLRRVAAPCYAFVGGVGWGHCRGQGFTTTLDKTKSVLVQSDASNRD